MSKRNRHNPHRPQHRGPIREFYSGFGFRHELVTANTNLHNYAESLETILDDEELQAVVVNPAKLSLKVIERMSVTKALKRERKRISKSDMAVVKSDVRRDLAAEEIAHRELTLAFDKIVPVGQRMHKGEKRTFALAPKIDHPGTEIIFAEHQICAGAMERRNLPEIRYPDSEWIPHLTVVTAKSEPARVGSCTESEFEVLLDAIGGPLEVKFKGLVYYDEQFESMVD